MVGPHDPSDRLTYWVLRLSEAGQHVVPPDLDAAVQYIDARGLVDHRFGPPPHGGSRVFRAKLRPP